MDGFHAAAELHRLGFFSPIIAMTANALMGDRERCLQHGLDDYIAKPVRAEDLRACIGKWIHAGGPPSTEARGSTLSPP